MLARLWWKEFRALGPSWPLLWLAAAGVQGLLLYAGEAEARLGMLAPIALIWAVLYAFAAGAAALAGERESRSMAWLDALPVARGSLWLGKASFALVSTFGLALALGGLAALGTEVRGPSVFGHDRAVREFGILLFEAVAWSLFWSSILANPLAAGALGVGSVGMILIGANAVYDRSSVHSTDLVAFEAFVPRLILATAALAGSALILIRPRLSRRPVVGAVGPTQEPIVPARASTGRSLGWQARREGQSTWLLVLAVGLFAAVTGGMRGYDGPDALSALMLAALATLAAGVSVFGPEGASGTRRFLLHQGVGPGQAWGHKVAVWGLMMGAIGAVFLLTLGLNVDPFSPRTPVRVDQPELVLASVLLDAFAVGILAGMAIRRRITAMLVGTIALVAIVPIQVGLEQQGMIPPWTLLATPVVLLGVSRAWAGDWLADREGFRPWAKLGLLLAVPAVLASVGYVGYRAFGVADVAQAPSVPPPAGEDLTDRYRRIFAEIQATPGIKLSDEAIDRAVRDEMDRPRPDDGVDADPVRTAVLAWRDLNAPVIAKVRRASAEGRGWLSLEVTGESEGPVSLGVRTLEPLLALEAQDRQARGDLAGAWEDVIALFRLGDQVGAGPASVIQGVRAADLQRTAAGLAFEWAKDPRQELVALRKARADLDRLAPPPSAVAAFRAESRAMDRLFDLPGDELGRIFMPNRTTILLRVGFNLIVASPWERRRARMVARRYLAGEADLASVEPWQRPRGAARSVADPEVRRTSPLAWRMMVATEHVQDMTDRQVEARGALEQVLAIRSWRLAHEGKMPATLEELVPGELPRLPVDPYSGRPYGYVPESGQKLPRRPRIDEMYRDDELETTGTGQRLLYSVGPDGVDDRAKSAYQRRTGRGDLVYPIP